MVVAGVLTGVVLVILFCRWQNNGLVVSHIVYQNPKIPQEFDGYKILHVSDLHNKNFGKAQSKLLAQAQQTAPDIIAVTGDLIDKRREGMGAAMAFISRAVKIAPVYYVPGNHEHTSGVYQKIRSRLSACGVCVVDDKTACLGKDGRKINLMGIKDREFFNTGKAYERMLSSLDEQRAETLSILLTHRPEKFELYQQFGFDLVMVGHAHGGQFRLPVIGGLYAPHQGVFPRYTSGLYMRGGKGMVVSRGLGNSLFPQRLFNRPELVVIELKSS